ncbi:hypothetical protein ACL58G_19720 [Massilia sp. GER05]|uniref:hypothetical protein n=1 Tax=Massilia sp. GER05 TaxID=3394605 RepID=UPI003F828482
MRDRVERAVAPAATRMAPSRAARPAMTRAASASFAASCTTSSSQDRPAAPSTARIVVQRRSVSARPEPAFRTT